MPHFGAPAMKKSGICRRAWSVSDDRFLLHCGAGKFKEYRSGVAIECALASSRQRPNLVVGQNGFLLMRSSVASFFRRQGRIRTVLIYAVVSFMPPLATGLLAILYTRVFTLAQYGTYGVLTSVIVLLGMLTDLGFSQAIVRDYYDRHRHDEDVRAYLGSVIYASTLISVALTPLLTLGLFFARDLFGLNHARMFLIPIIVLVAFFDRTTEMFAGICQAMERPQYFAVGRLAQTVVAICAAVVLVFVFRAGIPGAFVASLLAKASSTIVFHRIVSSALGIKIARPDWHAIRNCLGFGLPIVFNRTANWTRRVALRPVLTHVIPMAEVGAFSFGAALAELPALASTAIDLAIGPIYFKGRVDDEANFRRQDSDVQHFVRGRSFSDICHIRTVFGRDRSVA